MQSRLGKFYPWLVIAFLIIIYTSNFIDRTIFSLLVKPIRADLNITDTEYSLLAGFAFAVFYTFAGIPMGWIADHFSRRWIIAIGCGAWSLMTAVCGLANSFGGLFAARIGVGVGEATLSPSAYSLLADYFPKERLARAMSFYSLGIPLGSGLALIIGGSLVDAIASQGDITIPLVGTPKPWQIVFFVIGLPGLLLAVLTPMIIREPVRQNLTTGELATDAPGLKATIAYLWGHKGIYGTIILGVSLAALACYADNTWLPSFLQRVHGFTPGEAGKFLGFSTLILGIPGAISSGFLTDYLLSKGRVDAHLVVGRIWVTGIMVCGSIGPIVPIPWLSLTLIAGLGFFSFTWTGIPTALMQIITPNRMRGQLSGLYLFTVNIIGIGLGPTLVAASTDYIFGRDNAVGQSIALVGITALVFGILALEIARRRLLKSGLLSAFALKS